MNMNLVRQIVDNVRAGNDVNVLVVCGQMNTEGTPSNDLRIKLKEADVYASPSLFLKCHGRPLTRPKSYYFDPLELL